MSKNSKSSYVEVSIQTVNNNYPVLSKGFYSKNFNFDMFKSLYLNNISEFYIKDIVSEFRKSELKVITENHYSDMKPNTDKISFTFNISINGNKVLTKAIKTLGYTPETRRKMDLTNCLEQIVKDLKTHIADSNDYTYNSNYEGYEIPKNYFNKKWIAEIKKARIYANSDVINGIF